MKSSLGEGSARVRTRLGGARQVGEAAEAAGEDDVAEPVEQGGDLVEDDRRDDDERDLRTARSGQAWMANLYGESAESRRWE